MKRFLGPCLTALIVAGCADSALAPAVQDSNGPDLAAATTTSSKFAVSFLSFIPCANGGAGETVFIEGTLHQLDHVSLTGNGRATIKSQFQPQGVSGTGLTTGARYTGVGVTQTISHVWIGVEESYINNFGLIGQGPGNNFTIHERVRVTVSSDGTITTTHDSFRAECQ